MEALCGCHKQVFQVVVAKQQVALRALDKEVGSDDDEDTEACRTITGAKTEANSIYGHSASDADRQESNVAARP